MIEDPAIKMKQYEIRLHTTEDRRDSLGHQDDLPVGSPNSYMGRRLVQKDHIGQEETTNNLYRT